MQHADEKKKTFLVNGWIRNSTYKGIKNMHKAFVNNVLMSKWTVLI